MREEECLFALSVNAQAVDDPFVPHNRKSGGPGNVIVCHMQRHTPLILRSLEL